MTIDKSAPIAAGVPSLLLDVFCTVNSAWSIAALRSKPQLRFADGRFMGAVVAAIASVQQRIFTEELWLLSPGGATS